MKDNLIHNKRNASQSDIQCFIGKASNTKACNNYVNDGESVSCYNLWRICRMVWGWGNQQEGEGARKEYLSGEAGSI
jgi:hypothetical protein